MDAAMSTTFEPLSLSLRAWPEENAATNSLASLIPRITQQRGHLRNITEEGLLQEIQSSSSVPGEAQETVKGVVDDDAKVAVDDAPTRTAELMAAREDMIQRVSQAHTEAFYALDFVSLLLSKDTPRQAELSMSHHLQQHVPLGSLGVDRIQTPQIPASESADHVAVSRGWKMQGLQSTADSLLRSATRLEKEMESETKYWEQVLAIGDKGWSICRIPWERHTLGVRYGFLEATPEYRDRGLAALRRGDKGRVVLDRGRLSGQAKSVRVRMLDESGALSSVSTTPPLHLSTATTEESILNARNSIFEEELFFELGREARQLASQGVRIMDSTIHIQAGARTIIIDLVPLDDAPDLDSLDDGSVGLANAVALTLRILLSHAHRQNLHRRSEPPPPLTDRKRTLPPYSMLRPVLAHLRHQHSFTKVRNLIESFGAILKTAGLKTESVFRAASNCVSHLERSAAASQNRLQAMVELCTERVVSSADVSWPGSFCVRLELITQLHPPIVGDEFSVSVEAQDVETPRLAPVRFTSSAELASYLRYLLVRCLVAEVLRHSGSRSSGNPSVSDMPEESEVESGWRRSGEYNEVQKDFGQMGRSKRLKIEVSENNLNTRWAWMSGRKGTTDGSYSWTISPARSPFKSFNEVLAIAGSRDQ